jgi:hypothetical protein
MFGERLGVRLRLVVVLGGVFGLGFAASPARSQEGADAAAKDQRKLTALLEKSRDALRDEIKQRRDGMVAFWDPRVVDAGWLLLQTELDLADKPDERRALYVKHEKFLDEMDREKQRFRKQVNAKSPWPGLAAERLRAQVALLRERAGKEPSAEQSREIRKRLTARRDELRAQRRAEVAWADYLRTLPSATGQSQLDGCPEDLRRRLLDAELELTDKPDDRLALFRTYLDEVKANFAKRTRSDKFDAFPPPDTFPTEAHAEFEALRWDAEVVLVRAEVGGRKPTAEQADRLKDLLGKRADALRASADARRGLVKEGYPDYAAPRALDVYALRLRWALEDDPANPLSAWQAYQKDVDDLGELLKGQDKCAAAVKAMAEAARLRAAFGVLRAEAVAKPK